MPARAPAIPCEGLKFPAEGAVAFFLLAAEDPRRRLFEAASSSIDPRAEEGASVAARTKLFPWEPAVDEDASVEDLEVRSVGDGRGTQLGALANELSVTEVGRSDEPVLRRESHVPWEETVSLRHPKSPLPLLEYPPPGPAEPSSATTLSGTASSVSAPSPRPRPSTPDDPLPPPAPVPPSSLVGVRISSLSSQPWGMPIPLPWDHRRVTATGRPAPPSPAWPDGAVPRMERAVGVGASMGDGITILESASSTSVSVSRGGGTGPLPLVDATLGVAKPGDEATAAAAEAAAADNRASNADDPGDAGDAGVGETGRREKERRRSREVRGSASSWGSWRWEVNAPDEGDDASREVL